MTLFCYSCNIKLTKDYIFKKLVTNMINTKILLNDIITDLEVLRLKTISAIKQYVNDNNEYSKLVGVKNLAKITIEPIYTPVFCKVYKLTFDEDNICCFNVVDSLYVDNYSQFKIVSITSGIEGVINGKSNGNMTMIDINFNNKQYSLYIDDLKFENLYTILIALSTK